MSRSGYTDDAENVAMWRGQVASAMRGRRGQKLLRDLVAALDAMPEKRLIMGHLAKDGEVCALGAVGKYRGVDLSHCEELIDADGYCEDSEALAQRLERSLDISYKLAMEIQFMNDEAFDYVWDVPNPDTRPGQPRTLRRAYTPEERWKLMREWAVRHLAPESSP